MSVNAIPPNAPQTQPSAITPTAAAGKTPQPVATDGPDHENDHDNDDTVSISSTAQLLAKNVK